MLKANSRYTAKEILSEAKIDSTLIGQTRVLIGGIPVSGADHVVRIPSGTKTLEIVTGVDAKSIEIKDESKELELSPKVAELEKAKADEAAKTETVEK